MTIVYGILAVVVGGVIGFFGERYRKKLRQQFAQEIEKGEAEIERILAGK